MKAPINSKNYPASAYDDKLNLKLGIALWMVIVFLIKPYLVMLISFANRSNRTELIYTFYAHDGTLAMAELASLPAIAIFVAWIYRQPGANGIIRWIWRNGRGLLMTSTLLNAVLLVVSTDWNLEELGFLSVLQLALSILILLYLWFSDRVRDTFNDFPTS